MLATLFDLDKYRMYVVKELCVKGETIYKQPKVDYDDGSSDFIVGITKNTHMVVNKEVDRAVKADNRSEVVFLKNFTDDHKAFVVFYDLWEEFGGSTLMGSNERQKEFAEFLKVVRELPDNEEEMFY